MNKKILLLLLVMSMFILAACSSNGQPTGPSFNPFLGGTDSLVSSYIPGQPPKEEGAILNRGRTPFSIGLEISNKGEYDIDPSAGDLIDVRVKGLQPTQFGVTSSDLEQQVTAPLRGASRSFDGTRIEGELTLVSFDNLNYMPPSQGDIPRSFVTQVCFDYATLSTSAICLADDVTGSITSQSAREICTISGAKQTRNSAGPLHVVNMRQQASGGNRVNVMFDVTHVGQGEIYRYRGNNANPCDDAIANPEKHEVYVEVSLPAGSTANIECSGLTSTGLMASGHIRMFSRDRSVTCTIEDTSGQAGLIYEDMLQVDLYYRYLLRYPNHIIIKDAQ